ncbi:group I truncated hemoglobin [Nakamurella lactea]|uniref:group I truncated hemoglobin n=1 Tax=Nakamurella lactea TaxID=459515 RepID=UPI0004222E37|nr:group 1 truncated hemoglobin [Nakamurella lactea]
MSEVSEVTSDYERVGGGRAVTTVVARFYELVQADRRLAPFFADVDMVRLKRHQAALVIQVLGGPAGYEGRELAAAHRDLGIGQADFDRVVGHLVTALQEADVPDDIIGRVGEALSASRSEIVTACA